MQREWLIFIRNVLHNPPAAIGGRAIANWNARKNAHGRNRIRALAVATLRIQRSDRQAASATSFLYGTQQGVSERLAPAKLVAKSHCAPAINKTPKQRPKLSEAEKCKPLDPCETCCAIAVFARVSLFSRETPAMTLLFSSALKSSFSSTNGAPPWGHLSH